MAGAMRTPQGTGVTFLAFVAVGCGAAHPESVGSTTQGVASGDIYNFGALAHPGSCMDAQGGGTTDGTQIQEWTCNGTGAQSYELEDDGSGGFYIVNTQANKCVDVQGAGTADGTKIQLYDCNGTGAQTFVTEDAGNGFVYFVNTNSNKCLDVQGDNPNDGTVVQLYDCNQTAAQTWNPTVIGAASGSGGGGSSSGGTSSSSGGSSCDPNAWIYMGTNADACDGNVGEPCGWTTDNEGQGYTCQTVSWGTGCEPGGTVCPGGSSSGTSSGSGSGSSGSSSGGSTLPGWTLTWSDEFDLPDGSAVDSNNWNYDTGGSGWGNNELEYYTSGTSNAVIEDGKLVITATTEGASNYQCWYGTCQYTSARLNTSGTFSQQYGLVEASIQIPEGQGVWPAFWMLGNDIGSVGWPNCGEIDIMENIGSTPDTVYGTTHGPGPGSYPDDGLSGSFSAGAALGGGFHLYATEWSASSVAFYIDGTLYWTVTPSQLPAGATWVWDQPFFILLNFAVGGNWPGSPNASTSFPQQMIVDYVRVYQPAQ
jgi:beta-glucanase (GH16 family)